MLMNGRGWQKVQSGWNDLDVGRGVIFTEWQKGRGRIQGNLYAYELPLACKQNKGEIGTKALSENLEKQQPECIRSAEGRKINAEKT